MEKKINLWGILANVFLLSALSMSFFGLPNQALLIIAGILVMILIVLPLFLVLSNRQSSNLRRFNWGLTISGFLFMPSLFFFLQDILLPFKVALILLSLSGVYILWYFIHAFRQGMLIWNRPSFYQYWLLFVILLVLCVPVELQLADRNFNPIIETPAYSQGEGPLIYFDGGHNNFHTLDTRLYSTGRLLEQDGYQVQSYNEAITRDNLEKCKIFFVANALNKNNVEN